MGKHIGKANNPTYVKATKSIVVFSLTKLEILKIWKSGNTVSYLPDSLWEKNPRGGLTAEKYLVWDQMFIYSVIFTGK